MDQNTQKVYITTLGKLTMYRLEQMEYRYRFVFKVIKRLNLVGLQI